MTGTCKGAYGFASCLCCWCFKIASSVQAAKLARPQEFDILVLLRHADGRDETRRGMQIQLADLLFQGHPGHQAVDILVHVGLGGAGGYNQGSGEGNGNVFQVYIANIIH